MMNFKINTLSCISCMQCAKDCPMLIISTEEKFPKIKDGKESMCIKCQHCLAVCPTASLSIWDKDPKACVSVAEANVDPVVLEKLMMTRRSIRRFKSDEVSADIIDKIATTALYAPTGHNNKGVKLTIVNTREQLEKLRDMVYKALSDVEEFPEEYKFISNFCKLWNNKGVDVIFRGAPHIVFFSAPCKTHFSDADASISATYFDILANSYGIGTLWSGMNTYIFEDIVPELKSKIGIPEGHKMVIALLFGYSTVKYHRSVLHDKPNIEIINLSSF